MPADKPRPSLADYVTIALSPALIVAMIVSLVFFVLAVLYRGSFVERLHVILFFFIFGIVLVARIAMEDGYAERAPIYGGVLALLTMIALGKFVTYPEEVSAAWLVNGGLVAFAWWLAHRLVHSCTYIDEKAESTGTGLLDAAGLGKARDLTPPGPVGQEPGGRKKASRPSWWERYRQFREKRLKSQPPGVWVVYFALAALAIFGLGQALIDVGEMERRAHTFSLMALYLASSLGLLVTTAFLGLRRYLRQRRLEMPLAVTAAWLIVGAGLLVALVAIGAVLPRPRSELSLFDIVHADSKDTSSSKFAVTSGEAGKGKGRPGAPEIDPDGETTSSNDKRSSPKTAKGADSGKNPEKDGSATPDKQANDESGQSEAGDDGPSNPPSESAGSEFLKDVTDLISKLLKWIVFGILAIIAVLLILGHGLRYLANFTDWARRLLEALRRFWEGPLGWRAAFITAEEDAGPAPQKKHTPFRAFMNPFRDGRAERMTPGELVAYSFEALEAWADAAASARSAQETPIEFTTRVADEMGGIDEKTKQLGTLYACILYARGELPPNWAATVRDFWKRLEGLPPSVAQESLPELCQGD